MSSWTSGSMGRRRGHRTAILTCAVEPFKLRRASLGCGGDRRSENRPRRGAPCAGRYLHGDRRTLGEGFAGSQRLS